MDKILLIFVAGIGLSLITALGDALIKSASLQSGFSGWKLLLIGFLIWASTAFGWFLIMKRIKLSTAVVLYSVSLVTFATLISIFYFKEKIAPLEITGIVMAVASLVILARFA